MAELRDHALRAITEDGAFRVITLRTTALVQHAIACQGARGDEARRFAELLTATALIRETMSPGHRVQAVLAGAAGTSLIGDARPMGRTRGLVSRPDGQDAPRSLGDGALLKVIRSLPGGRLHQSVVEAGESGVSDAVMSYLQTSEQVLATIRVACRVDGDRVRHCGGYIVQLLPECQREALAIMTERLADAAYLDGVLSRAEAAPDAMMRELLWGFPYEVLADEPMFFGCDCSEERVVAALSTLPRDEITAIVERREVVDLHCEYCRTRYAIAPSRLEAMLTPS